MTFDVDRLRQRFLLDTNAPPTYCAKCRYHRNVHTGPNNEFCPIKQPPGTVLPSLKLREKDFLDRMSKLDPRLSDMKEAWATKYYALKEEKRSATSAKHVKRRQWGTLIQSLRYEMSNTQSSLNYYRKDEMNNSEMIAVLSTYKVILDKLYARMASQRYAGITIAEYRDEVRSKREVANDGMHWSDYVPEQIKAALIAAHASTPHRKHAKSRELFRRVVKPTSVKPAPKQPDGEDSSHVDHG